MKVYPVFLNKLDRKKTVIIGGNHEAERKTRELLECDANICLIHPTVTDDLLQLANQGRIKWIKRGYREGDLEGACLVIVAEYNGNTNQRVYEEAEEKEILINVMDDSEHCTFTFGSMVKRGPLTLSISTSGSAPALAVRLRQRFEREFGEEYARFLNLARALRKPMARNHSSFSERRKLWYRLIDSDVLNLLEQDQTELAYQRASEIVGASLVEEAKRDQNRI